MNLISCISKNVGSGEIAITSAEDPLMSDIRYKYLLIDMFFKPSELMFEEKEQDEEEAQQDEEGGEQNKEVLFEWYSEYGLEANIEKVRVD